MWLVVLCLFYVGWGGAAQAGYGAVDSLAVGWLSGGQGGEGVRHMAWGGFTVLCFESDAAAVITSSDEAVWLDREQGHVSKKIHPSG